MTRLRVRGGWLALIVVGLIVTVIAPFASSAPDAWNRVASDSGLADSVRGHRFAGSFFADYGFPGLSGAAATAAAGCVGVVAVMALAWLSAVAIGRLPQGKS